MKFKIRELDIKYIEKALLCIIIGTGSGLGTYIVFLKLNIAIFGWNLGLIFAPLVAGYIETKLANRIIGENLGAISAFILFIDTTIYSFIIKNPSLGFNLITIGSAIIILQAAFPTLINHILIVVLAGFASKFIKESKKIFKKLKYYFDRRPTGYWDSSSVEIKTNAVAYFDEEASNMRLNSLNFIFLTNTDLVNATYEIMGIYQSEIILEKSRSHSLDPEKEEKQTLMRIKEGKDDCLVNLVEKIKKNGGNCILDLTLHYASIGLKGDNIQITATGIGVDLKSQKSLK